MTGDGSNQSRGRYISKSGSRFLSLDLKKIENKKMKMENLGCHVFPMWLTDFVI